MTQSDVWNPAQYERFRAEREQPFLDLLALVAPAAHARVIDLGCGTGRGTITLHQRLAAAATVGLDQSDRMLAVGRAAAPAGVTFKNGSLDEFDAKDEYDLVFSNSALHWVGNHAQLIPRLVQALRPRGQLAFQLPAMHDAPSHTVALELAREEPYHSALDGWVRPQPVLPPEQYTRLMFRSGLRPPRVMLVVYPHVLSGPDEVVEWTRGTLLTDYERRMNPDVYASFVAEYRRRVAAAFGPERPLLFPYKRILCWGRLE